MLHGFEPRCRRRSSLVLLGTAGQCVFVYPVVDPDETLGEALFLHSWEYFREVARMTDLLARSAHIYFQQGVAAALVGPAVAVFVNGEQIVAVEARGVKISAFLDFGSPLAQDGSAGINPADFRIFHSLEASSLEHSVLEEIFGAEAVSTVKVLQLAAEQGIPLFDIDSSNRATLVPQLTLSAFDIASIEAYLDAGYKVKVPRDPLTLNLWIGTGWLAFTPGGTSVSSIISGYLNGGSITEIKAELVELVRTGEITQQEADLILFSLFDRIRFPVDATISSPFGMRNDPFTGEPLSLHEGLDFPVDGVPVFSVADGFVAARYLSSTFGNTVIVNHGVDDVGNTYYSLQAHNDSFSVNFLDNVSQGDQLSISGETGRSTGPHLHYQVHVIPPGGPDPDADVSGAPTNSEFFSGGYEVDPADLVWPDLTLISNP